MFDKMNPLLRGVIMFVTGSILLLLVYWLVPVIKNTEVELNWIKIIGGGILIAVLDLIFPSGQRRKNREDLKNSFKK